jgi:cobyrinic acid a,c-diamide synthase
VSLRLHGHAVTLLPRVVVAGLSGDSGKSLVTLSLIRALKQKGLRTAPYKKGPDYIDAAWLARAAGLPGRNLDTFLMPASAILKSLGRADEVADIIVMEGNRGLYDGMTAKGDHSTATLAKITGTPVVLVVDATKTTRTVAAMVRGCQVLDPDVIIGGVVLNRVATTRQERVIREAVESDTGLTVMGAVPRLGGQLLPSRHLGLVTAVEHPDAEAALENAGAVGEKYLEIDAIIELANSAAKAPSSTGDPPPVEQGIGLRPSVSSRNRPRIGVLRDRAFSFYYPENLSSLEEMGATLVSISPLSDDALPDIDALYAGGGFPEIYARDLSSNARFRDSLRRRIDDGLPVWAECGGLMYLAESLAFKGEIFPMVGALPVEVEQTERPEGHGYVEGRVDAVNPFFETGTAVRGHEFHYSRVVSGLADIPTVFSMTRGSGLGMGRDGIHVKNVVATYTHLHALGTPEWASGFFAAI